MSVPPPSSSTTVSIALSAGTAGVKRLLVGTPRGEHRLTLTPTEIVVEHSRLVAPLRFAPGSIAVAALDQGPAQPPGDAGRFPILHRLSPTAVVPRREGIEGWLWTTREESSFLLLGDEAPNVAFIFSPPLVAERLEGVLSDEQLADVAKRSPLGQPALFGLLLRAGQTTELVAAFGRYGFRSEITDREVPPTQRRHLPTDKPANPALAATQRDRAASVAPPGMG